MPDIRKLKKQSAIVVEVKYVAQQLQNTVQMIRVKTEDRITLHLWPSWTSGFWIWAQVLD